MYQNISRDNGNLISTASSEMRRLKHIIYCQYRALITMTPDGCQNGIHDVLQSRPHIHYSRHVIESKESAWLAMR